MPDELYKAAEPDHDRLIRVETILATDHQEIKRRLSEVEKNTVTDRDHEVLEARTKLLEERAARATGVGLVLLAIVGIVGIVVGAVFQHIWVPLR